MAIHLGPALQRGSCGLPFCLPPPVRFAEGESLLMEAWRRFAAANPDRWGDRAGDPKGRSFGLAPRRDCRVSRQGGWCLAPKVPDTATARTRLCGSDPQPALQSEGRAFHSEALISPEVIGIRCPLELGLSSPHQNDGGRPSGVPAG